MHPEAAPHSALLVTVGDPKGTRMLAAPRRARIRWRTYGDEVVELDVDVVALTADLVCVRQEVPGRAPWNAWLPRAALSRDDPDRRRGGHGEA